MHLLVGLGQPSTPCPPEVGSLVVSRGFVGSASAISQESNPTANWQKSGVSVGHQVLRAWVPWISHTISPLWD